MKKSYTFIFVVVVYRNSQDLIDFFESFGVANSRVIVVNSYFDEKSKQEFENIAKYNDADFLNVENKGYGAGNNWGIQFALDHYDFNFLIVSNADIYIEQLGCCIASTVITAPNIITLKDKCQNPHTPYHFKFLDKWKYLAFSKNNRWPLRLALGINKICRVIFRYIVKFGFKKNIYAPHGAFIIIPKNILQQLHPIFDEQMFLFAEEDVLAYKAKMHKILIEYNPKIVIRHKEDGSVSSISDKVSRILKESYMYFYNTYCLDNTVQ